MNKLVTIGFVNKQTAYINPSTLYLEKTFRHTYININ